MKTQKNLLVSLAIGTLFLASSAQANPTTYYHISDICKASTGKSASSRLHSMQATPTEVPGTLSGFTNVVNGGLPYDSARIEMDAGDFANEFILLARGTDGLAWSMTSVSLATGRLIYKYTMVNDTSTINDTTSSPNKNCQRVFDIFS